MQVMLVRLMSKGEYLIVPKGTKFTGAGKLGLNRQIFGFYCFLKNTVPCEFPLLKLNNFYIFYLIGFQVMTKTIFTKTYPASTQLRGRYHP